MKRTSRGRQAIADQIIPRNALADWLARRSTGKSTKATSAPRSVIMATSGPSEGRATTTRLPARTSAVMLSSICRSEP